MDRKNTIVKGTLVLVLYYIAAKILSFLIEVLIASKIGPCVETDAYYLVDGIILSLSPMLSVGIWKLFMPEYKSRIVNNLFREASEITHRLILVFFLISLFLSIIIIIFTKDIVHIYAPGFDNNSIGTSVSILNILVFTFVLGTITTFPSAILQSGNHFSKSQLKEIVLFIPPLVYLICFISDFGITGLAYSVLVGYILALVSQYYLVLPYYKFKFRIDIINKETIRILKLYPIACINSVILQLNGVIGKMFSSTLAIGSITFLNYGGKIIHLFNGVFSTAISVAIFPHLTELLIKNETTEIKKFFNHYLSIICAILIPVTILVVIFSEDIIHVLFGYGKFDSNSAKVTSQVLFMYGLGLVAMGLTTFIDDVFYIRKRIKILLFTTIINIICNVIFAFLLIKKYEVAGLALSSTISLYISLLIKSYFIRDLIFIDKMVKSNFISILLAGIVSFLFMYGAKQIDISSGFYIIDLIIGSFIFILIYVFILLHNSFYKQQCKGLVQTLRRKIFHC